MLDNFIYLFEDFTFFWFCALAGTGLFFIQFLLNLSGFSDVDDLDGGSDDFGDGKKLKWLSIQAISGFLMMFGWTAITSQKEFDIQLFPAMGLSLATGLITVLITRFIFKTAKKLESRGNLYKIDEIIGKEAYVYQRIPKEGMGKISISLQQITHEINAISHNREELPSFTRVQILNKQDDTTVVVIPIP